MRVEKDHAYLLHAAPYRENSVMATFFTLTHGKVSFIIGGIRAGKKSNKKALLQPCFPVVLAYQLKDNFSKLLTIEPADKPLAPSAKYFMLYQYVHELLIKILPKHLPSEMVFMAYRQFLSLLYQQRGHTALRYMECCLIDVFDSFPNVVQTQDTQAPVTADSHYFIDHSGVALSALPSDSLSVSGERLIAFSHLYRYFQAPTLLSAMGETADAFETLAKETQPITRFFINRLLGQRGLKTRDVYRDLHGMALVNP